ncbi:MULTISPECIES: hypothetical protein [Williamsia]|uniref:Uncharacterized protein n=1 Tax=Williamsia marianensis TaxID=85044 RepID=A0ABU4EQS2_WILMA|nr:MULTISPECIES: hypothetical protein [Williamsia]MCK0516419.1 hypothetical protein [Williamsia sp. DF01-3]MDV7133607.1 hypothetical protein [Williamsia muralis]
MKLAKSHNSRRTPLLGRHPHIFGSDGLIAHRRLARMLPEEGERLVTVADLRNFNL